MKRIRILILICIGLCLVQIANAQEMRLVKGTLRGNDGKPLLGVNILEKGTQHGVVTDINGSYRIEVPLGSVLVYSFIGFSSYEKKVTLANSEPVNYKPVPGQVKQTIYKSSYSPVENNFSNGLNNDTSGNEGSASFTNSSQTFLMNQPGAYWKEVIPKKISKIDFNKKVVQINHAIDKYYSVPSVTFSSYYSIEEANRLPELQNTYAQGRPINGFATWQGPETGEIFSWGPAITNLEYDGSGYDFDKNGRIVLNNAGNGKKVKSYDPLTFFTKGYLSSNALIIESKTDKLSYNLSATHSFRKGIIPGSEKNADLFEGKIRKKFGDKTWFKSNILFENSKGHFMSGSPVLNILMSSVFTTPPTFDNQNGFSTKEAVKNTGAYLVDNSNQRSYSVSSANNPYWLINNLIDEDNYQNLFYNTSLEIKMASHLDFVLEAGLQNQMADNETGFPDEIKGMDSIYYLKRSDQLFSFNTNNYLRFFRTFYSLEVNSSLIHNFKYSEHKLSRLDRNGESNNKPAEKAFRRTHTLSWPLHLNYDDKVLGKFTQSLVFSGNDEYSKVMYMPSLGAGLRLDEIFRFYHPYLKIRANWGYILSEVPLSFALGTYSYQNIESESYVQSFYNSELSPDFTLYPEKLIKKGAGLDFEYAGKVTFAIDIYSNITKNGIFPVVENDLVQLKNLADLKSEGIEVDLKLGPFYSRIIYSFGIIFSNNKNIVTRLNNGYNHIPLSGYSDTYTALIEGQPKGVIVGTQYLRNENGQLVIGTNGYPLVDPELQILGDPNPDYTMGFTNNFKFRNFNLNIIFEYQKGGEIWNGTENVLSYYGTAAAINDERNTSNYVYKGVNENGDPNQVFVDFANPARSLESNKWYNYGPAGIAEDAIQNASNFRIRDISLSFNRFIKKVKIEVSVFAKNPVLITKYKGVDSESLMWGNPSAYGLDMFNCPSVKSFGIGMKMKF